MQFSSLLLKPCHGKAEAWIEADAVKAVYLQDLNLPQPLADRIRKWQDHCRIHYTSDVEAAQSEGKELGQVLFAHFNGKIPLVIEFPDTKLVWEHR